jgi:predicted GIY-YIG superfamily endonuclease
VDQEQSVDISFFALIRNEALALRRGRSYREHHAVLDYENARFKLYELTLEGDRKYVGISSDPKRRFKQHKNNSAGHPICKIYKPLCMKVVGRAKGLRKAMEMERKYANRLRESGVVCYGGEQQPVNPKSKGQRRAERSAKLKAARLAKKAEKSNCIHLPTQAETRASA